ncbi:hypothetical protein Cni_G03223 [Canna indica]|uniref:Uncharacterized protein n=1 Tax=Canna indica TaxID=4628 RepID=A0AAQ3JQP8_9LILI|nr:hypothetical protein Cni_G03223 [Canna indica]
MPHISLSLFSSSSHVLPPFSHFSFSSSSPPPPDERVRSQRYLPADGDCLLQGKFHGQSRGFRWHSSFHAKERVLGSPLVRARRFHLGGSLGRQRSPSLSSVGVVLAIDEGEERWQRGGGKVSVVRVEAAYLNGKEAKCFDTHDVDGLVWFKTINCGGGRESIVKLSYPIWERIKWEESRVGCNDGEDEKVERVEEYRGGVGGWKRFNCYVLVERFVLRRMDGSGVLMVDFRHNKKVHKRRSGVVRKRWQLVGGRREEREKRKNR